MRISKGLLYLILIFLMLGMIQSVALANATQSGKIISQTIEDTREVITDNLALAAEVEEINKSLTLERQATQELIFNLNKYTETSEQEKDLLRENNSILLKQITLLERKNKQAVTAGWIKLVLGLAAGYLIAN